MSSEAYLNRAQEIIKRIESTQMPAIRRASRVIATSISAGGWCYIFGSGHSVIPVLDIFPRYGSYVGFFPLMDPRLMWFNVVGPGGAPELLWLERQPGYIQHFLASFLLQPRDSFLVFSHGGLNAAPIEAALEGRRLGLTVIGVASGRNQRETSSSHPSGKKLFDCCDIVIDNCVEPEDAQVELSDPQLKVGAGSTLAAVAISMALVCETASQLEAKGHPVKPFVSPNVAGVSPNHNRQIFEDYRARARSAQ